MTKQIDFMIGASSGIGRATLRGSWVDLVGRGRDGLQATRRDTDAAGGTLVPPTHVAMPGPWTRPPSRMRASLLSRPGTLSSDG